ncbi:transcriptional regulatory protein AlgP-like [Homalodisca vitripennis]|uniref:transcriptional regulatory protein AlgP-like n=1 Tax=Homalodisca vitripennis TaxID=197043 RepID=UPI001EEA2178|nr:transcriptional regulatory protein AlgP-like [Homalodisca vitripennis]
MRQTLDEEYPQKWIRRDCSGLGFLAYADPIYSSSKGVAQLPAVARVAPYWLAGAYASPAAAAASGYPVDISSENSLNLNAATKVLALDQASTGAPSGYAPASYAPLIQGYAPAATRVYTAAGLPTVDAAASGYPVTIEAEDSLSAAVKTLANSQANVGAASSYAPYYKSVMTSSPATFPSTSVVAITKLSPTATRVLASAKAAADYVSLNSAAAMAKFAPAATRAFGPVGAAADYVSLNPVDAATNYGPAATRAFGPVGAAADYVSLNPAAAATNYGPAATRAFGPVGAAADYVSLNPAAAATNYGPAATRVFGPVGAAADYVFP